MLLLAGEVNGEDISQELMSSESRKCHENEVFLLGNELNAPFNSLCVIPSALISFFFCMFGIY